MSEKHMQKAAEMFTPYIKAHRSMCMCVGVHVWNGF